MSPSGSHLDDVVAKVVLTGVSGSGKSMVLRAMARRYAHESVRVGEVAGGSVFRTEFFWPQELADGRRLRIKLFALSGAPAYNAANELLLTGCAGLVFYADVRPERLDEAREALRSVVFNAGRSGVDLASLPMAVQYHYPGAEPQFDPDKMDQWLGMTPGSVVRFMASREGNEGGLCAGVEEVVRRVGREFRLEKPLGVS